MKRIAGLMWVVTVLIAMAEGSVYASQVDNYWDWGWGTYGSGIQYMTVADVARFDWSYIRFGDEPGNQALVDWCNEILKINPRHKFVLRIWPITGLGDCPENRSQATFLHYFYQPNVKKEMFKRIHEQFDLMKRISRPENVVGSTFLEELPAHFSSSPFKFWKKGDPMPWDIKRFQKEIEAELGEPFTWLNEKHRAWWGKKWVQVINEIHQVMKETSGGQPVIYYQMTIMPTLDYYETLLQADPANTKKYSKETFVPIHYADVVKPGLCDGIMGYPNNQNIWENQVQSVVRNLNCLVFSQVSAPPGMRLCKLDEMAELARWKNPGNLGSFFYTYEGRKKRAWNELSYQDDGYWTVLDHLRRFGWDHQIGMDIVAKCLAPKVELDYSLKDQKLGFLRVHALIHNPRNPSWYGGRTDLAGLKQVRATLKVPDGFSIPKANNPGDTLDLGDMAADEYRVADWWVKLDSNDPVIPSGQAFHVTVTAQTASGEKTTRGEATSSALDQVIKLLETHYVARSGDTWVEPAFRLPAYPAAVELRALSGDVLFPTLVCGTYRQVVYRDVLGLNTSLRIGPGHKATLLALPIFDEKIQHFAPHLPNADGEVTFDKGYSVFTTRLTPVRAGEKYKVHLTGRAQGGNILVTMVFRSWIKGKMVSQSKQVLVGGLTDQVKTIESLPIEVPRFGDTPVNLQLFFYRQKSEGMLALQSFECRRADIPEVGLDVSNRLEGVLADLIEPFTVWTYKDLSDPVRYKNRKIEIRFLHPDEVRALEELKQ